MTIALLTDGIYPYVIGGMQRHSFYLAKYLAKAGHKIVLYHTNQGELDISLLEGFSEEEKKNITPFVIEFPKFGQAPGHYIRESYEYSRRVWNIYKKQERPDFIIIKGFAGWEILNQKSKGVSFPPIGINFHGYEMFQKQSDFISRMKSRLLLKSPVLFNIRQADYLFSYGAKITGIILNLGIPKERIIEIPTGISEDWLNKSAAENNKIKKFVFSGRYERRKGVEELNKVLKALIAEKKDFEFHFIGEIPLNKRIVSDKVIYHGLVRENEKLKSILRSCDILVCPSYAEGMPNVVMEALACGLAVIATDTGATSIMVNEKNGWLISPGNFPELKNAMEEGILLDEKKLRSKKNEAVTIVENNFLWDQIAAKTAAVLAEKIK